ncbi:type IV secretory protease [Desulfurispirillum indicum S5]|uniref:Type IV secretory protease n=1 Tax=Desulfurispirillum indicum (strain ATCC BAA-1389 / DSM 22839 / S5) TaxID=653733 RepID=E6W6W4_DESIS|nr:type IV secretory protease [Desulfurispirillum indicum S5]
MLPLLLTAFILLIGYLAPRLVVSTTPSLPHTVFWRTDKPVTKLMLGDYCHFAPPASISWQHLPTVPNPMFIKRASCMPGQQLVRQGEHFYCDGQYIATALKRRQSLERYPSFTWDGPVPAGQVFVTGSHPQSLDSRYFGFVSLTAINEILKGVL